MYNWAGASLPHSKRHFETAAMRAEILAFLTRWL
jgi:hypothetical protein